MVSPLWLAVIRVDPDIPNVMPLEFSNSTVPLVPVCVPAAAAIPPPAPGAAADSDSVNPALLLAVVPEMLVRLSCGSPWLWFDNAPVVM